MKKLNYKKSGTIDFTASIATTNQDIDGDKLDPACLQRMKAALKNGMGVSLSFQGPPIGRVDSARLTKTSLKVRGHFFAGQVRKEWDGRAYIVPGYVVDQADIVAESDNVRVFKKVRLTGLAVTLTPADPSLDPVQLEDMP